MVTTASPSPAIAIEPDDVQDPETSSSLEDIVSESGTSLGLRVVYPLRTQSGHGCAGATTELQVLSDVPVTRDGLAAAREIVHAGLVSAFEATLSLTALEPAPVWDEKFAGTRGEFESQMALWDAAHEAVGALVRQTEADALAAALAYRSWRQFVPLGWSPYEIGDNPPDNWADRVWILSSTFEYGCACGHTVIYPSDPTTAARAAILAETSVGSFLVSLTESDRLAQLADLAEGVEVELATASRLDDAAERLVADFKPLSGAELASLDFSSWEAYQTQLAIFSRLQDAGLPSVRTLLDRRRGAWVTSGLLPVVLDERQPIVDPLSGTATLLHWDGDRPEDLDRHHHRHRRP